MIQQRKKDYLQKIIEEFFSKLQQLTDSKNKASDEEKKTALDSCFLFFFNNFEINEIDAAEEVLLKIDSYELSEQYANLLVKKYELQNTDSKDELEKALTIITMLEKSDSTYSWSRTILKEDILRLLDTKN